MKKGADLGQTPWSFLGCKRSDPMLLCRETGVYFAGASEPLSTASRHRAGLHARGTPKGVLDQRRRGPLLPVHGASNLMAMRNRRSGELAHG